MFISKIKTIVIYSFCLGIFLITLGNFVNLGKISDKRVKLGSDLKKGKQIILQVDINSYIENKLLDTIDELKNNFKVNKIKAVPVLVQSNNQIQIKIQRTTDLEKTKNEIENYKEFLVTTEEYLISMQLKETAIRKIERNLVKQSIRVLDRRLSKVKKNSFVVQKADGNQILIQTLDDNGISEIKKTIKKTAKLTFHFVNTTPNSYTGLKKVKQKNSNFDYYIERKPLLSGDFLLDAQITYYRDKPTIIFHFNQKGTQQFAKITKENIGKFLAIVLDDEIIMAPKINMPITNGTGMISGNFSEEEALEIANLLKAGALPTPLTVIKESDFEGILQNKSAKNVLKAILTLGIVFALFFFVAYKKFGWFINLVFVLNLCLIASILGWFDIVLTMYGLMAIGLALIVMLIVNILIFEEMKSARKQGGRTINSLQNGFNKGSKVFLYSAVLVPVFSLAYLFGNYALKSFSLIFIISFLSSLFMSVIFTRWLIMWNLDKFNLKHIKFR